MHTLSIFLAIYTSTFIKSLQLLRYFPFEIQASTQYLLWRERLVEVFHLLVEGSQHRRLVHGHAPLGRCRPQPDNNKAGWKQW